MAADPELLAEDLRTQELHYRFNLMRPGSDAERRALLVELFDTLPLFRCDYGSNISIGDDAFINYDYVFLDCNRSTIGRDVQIARRV